MGSLDFRKQARLKRKRRVRKNISGTSERPRLSVFRSKRHIYAQVVDDTIGHTLAAASTLDSGIANLPKDGGKKAAAAEVGKNLGKRAMEKGVKKVVFDRNGFLYHGRIKAVSDGAREAGLDF